MTHPRRFGYSWLDLVIAVVAVVLTTLFFLE
jgi:hypothetical protein